MSTVLADPLLTAAAGLLVKATVLLCLAAIAQLVLRTRASAAARHAVWTLTIAALLALPVLSVVLPAWTVITIAAASQARLKPGPTTGMPTAPGPTTGIPAGPSLTTEIPVVGPGFSPASLGVSTGIPALAPSAQEWSLVSGVAPVYLSGVALMSLLLGLQWRRASRLAGAADAVTDPAWRQLLTQCADAIGIRRAVALRRSRARSLPMVLGIRRPLVIIPAIADSWSDDRRRAVMRHELAHVARHDCLTQTLAHAACALYWFHPGVWWAARQMRIERELACDDLVITAGTEARDYATHLLEIAYASGPQQSLALAVNMASPRHLEGRLRAALDAARNRRVPRHRMRVAGVVGTLALVGPLSSATMTQAAAQEQPHRIERELKPIGDVFGGRLERLRRWTVAAVGFMQGAYTGTWEVRASRTSGVVHLRLTELNSSSGSDVAIDQLEGLTLAQLTGPGGPVQFRIRRDAGTLVFEGVVRNGVGAGTFTFDANPAFRSELAKRGFAAPNALEQYQLARGDVGYAFIDELTRQGYAKPDTATLVRAGQHGVSTTYLRDMGALGYRLGTLDPLITLRDHGVTPAYVGGMAALGYKGISADELRQARDHGVTPEYVSGMRQAGYSGLPLAQLIETRDHGVDAEFLQGLADAGYRSLAIDQAIKVRDHGVDVAYVSAMRALGHGGAPIATLVRLRDHGVTPQYIEELKDAGYDGLPAEDLVMLRDHGATADRIRAANARAGTKLPLDMLRALARRGGLQ